MEFSKNDCDSLFNILKWRRDVRHFLADPVPHRLIEQLQAAMFYAPSVGNSRPWRVFHVQSDEKRESVHKIFEKSNHDAASIYTSERAAEYNKLKLEGIRKAPVQLAIFTDTKPEAGHGLGCQSMVSTLEHSTAMAVQNLNLVACALGLGVGMVSILDPIEMQELFTVPASWSFSFYLCIGWPSFTSDTPLLHRVGWQENLTNEWTAV